MDGLINCFVSLDSFIVTPNARPPIGTLQKRIPTLTRTTTQLNRRAVIVHKKPVTDPKTTLTNAL
jgi:hypothetical protein